MNSFTQMPWLKIGKFTLVNVIAFVPNILVALIFMYLGVQYIVASLCGVAVHAFILFFANRSWTFVKPEIKAGPGLSKSAIIEVFIVAVMLTTLSLLVENAGLDPKVARLFSSIPSGILGWILYSYVVFEDHPFKDDEATN